MSKSKCPKDLPPLLGQFLFVSGRARAKPTTIMAPRLRISAGPDVFHMGILAVNHDENSAVIDTDNFVGRITVRVKNFHGENPHDVEHHTSCGYFTESYGKNMSYSIQAQGRFKKTINADELVLGNAFDEPIRDSLPYGTCIALQFINLIDPNLKQDLYADKPWAFSPLLATVYRAQAHRAPKGTFEDCKSAKDCFNKEAWPFFPTAGTKQPYVLDDITPLFKTAPTATHLPTLLSNVEPDKEVVSQMGPNNRNSRKARNAWLSSQERRERLVIQPDDIITVDFCNGFVSRTQCF